MSQLNLLEKILNEDTIAGKRACMLLFNPKYLNEMLTKGITNKREIFPNGVAIVYNIWNGYPSYFTPFVKEFKVVYDTLWAEDVTDTIPLKKETGSEIHV
jgi:hypothetical protein